MIALGWRRHADTGGECAASEGRISHRKPPSSRANSDQGGDLSLSALGVTNQAYWVALFADFAWTLRVDFRGKIETAELPQAYALGRRPEAGFAVRIRPPLVGGFRPPW